MVGIAKPSKGKLKLLRTLNTMAALKYTMSGRERPMPPMTLPKLKCLEEGKKNEG